MRLQDRLQVSSLLLELDAVKINQAVSGSDDLYVGTTNGENVIVPGNMKVEGVQTGKLKLSAKDFLR